MHDKTISLTKATLPDGPKLRAKLGEKRVNATTAPPVILSKRTENTSTAQY